MKELIKLSNYHRQEKEEEDESESQSDTQSESSSSDSYENEEEEGTTPTPTSTTTATLSVPVAVTLPSTIPSLVIERKAKTAPIIQNVHALNVVKRVKQKLEGTDGLERGAGSMTVTEQVNWVIKEATSTHNLSRMYEGWTSWI
eukprot:TRINITY_DN14223_c0_g2_i2.p1 TRINITY_DN14223_c0_g2~~TRINITY_DN14223_c0_g2_i2.p1  ORF type:complete len:144 (-),score=37.19 TRINITY_DN14223_c0_g2_i2:204-635(-)